MRDQEDLQLSSRTPRLLIVFDIPALLPNSAVRIVKWNCVVKIEHVNISRLNSRASSIVSKRIVKI